MREGIRLSPFRSRSLTIRLHHRTTASQRPLLPRESNCQTGACSHRSVSLTQKLSYRRVDVRPVVKPVYPPSESFWCPSVYQTHTSDLFRVVISRGSFIAGYTGPVHRSVTSRRMIWIAGSSSHMICPPDASISVLPPSERITPTRKSSIGAPAIAWEILPDTASF